MSEIAGMLNLLQERAIEAMMEKEREEHMKQCEVNITRADFGYGVLRKLDVYVDDRKIGAVGWTKTITIELPAGPHIFYVKMDWLESPRVEFACARAGCLELAVGAKSPLFAGIRSLIPSSNFFFVRESKYKEAR